MSRPPNAKEKEAEAKAGLVASRGYWTGALTGTAPGSGRLALGVSGAPSCARALDLNVLLEHNTQTLRERLRVLQLLLGRTSRDQPRLNMA